MNFRSLFLCVTVVLLASAFVSADYIHKDPQLDSVILKANETFMEADFDKGISLLQSLEKSYPSNPAVSFFIANGYWWKIFRAYIYDKEANTDEVGKSFDHYISETIGRSESLLEANRKDVVGLFYLGNAYSLKSRTKGLKGSYFSAGRDAARGKSYLEEVLKIDPGQYDAYYNLGVYNYFADTLPGFAKFLKTLLFLPGGSRSKGLSLLKQAAEKSTYFGAESQLILARFYADFEEQPYDALRIVEAFHKRYPDNAWFHYWMGTLYSDEINDYSQSTKIYEQILEKCNQGVTNYTMEVKTQAWLRLARAYNRLLYPEKAIEEIQKLIASKPNNPTWITPRAYLELGNIYDQIGMRKEAINAYNRVLTYRDYRDFHEQAKRLLVQNYNQTVADIYRLNLEGRRFASSSHFGEAETAFRKVLEKYPNNEQTLYAMAEMHYMKGSYTEAASLLNTILNRHPKEPKWLLPGVYVRLGQVYEASQQADAARRSYEKALDTKFIASDDRNTAKRALKQITQGKNS